ETAEGPRKPVEVGEGSRRERQKCVRPEREDVRRAPDVSEEDEPERGEARDPREPDGPDRAEARPFSAAAGAPGERRPDPREPEHGGKREPEDDRARDRQSRERSATLRPIDRVERAVEQEERGEDVGRVLLQLGGEADQGTGERNERGGDRNRGRRQHPR